MRDALIAFFKVHPSAVRMIWKLARFALRIWGWFVPVQPKTMVFCSFGGRKYDDSPKAIYEEVCRRNDFDGWRLIWAFVNPDDFNIERGEKVKVDTLAFFKALLQGRVWVSNSGMDRGIGMHRKKTLRVETWHGVPLKKIGADQHQKSLAKKTGQEKRKLDADTIRCAQSEYDRDIFARTTHSEKSAFLVCDLPRNDSLFRYSKEQIAQIKQTIGIPLDKKVILYAPTYREFLIDEHNRTFIAPPMDLQKWEEVLGSEYVLLFRAHYAVAKALGVKNTEFVKDVSKYPTINDLYIVADILLSDYSSSYFDYSILDRPMLCFAYDYEEYERKRGLYLNLEETLPCSVDYDEDSLLKHIMTLDFNAAAAKTKLFHQRFAPHAGHASKVVVDEIISRLAK